MIYIIEYATELLDHNVSGNCTFPTYGLGPRRNLVVEVLTRSSVKCQFLHKLQKRITGHAATQLIEVLR
jgi:hypothetical protein